MFAIEKLNEICDITKKTRLFEYISNKNKNKIVYKCKIKKTGNNVYRTNKNKMKICSSCYLSSSSYYGYLFRHSEDFDTENHDILQNKLNKTQKHKRYRNNLIKNYLTNRRQALKINGVTSNSKNIICGIPQGTILGPLLFII